MWVTCDKSGCGGVRFKEVGVVGLVEVVEAEVFYGITV